MLLNHEGSTVTDSNVKVSLTALLMYWSIRKVYMFIVSWVLLLFVHSNCFIHFCFITITAVWTLCDIWSLFQHVGRHAERVFAADDVVSQTWPSCLLRSLREAPWTPPPYMWGPPLHRAEVVTSITESLCLYGSQGVCSVLLHQPGNPPPPSSPLDQSLTVVP